jgi:GPH family glycoside/pentoside/hexuronide:cation symporter
MQKTQKVSFKQRISWGLGGWADNFIFQTLIILALPIYNIEMGIDPVWIGIALALPRFLDAITDPLMGNISDNSRSRWGRRRPWIFIGAATSACLLPLLWMPPVEGDLAKTVYFGFVGTLYALSYTMFVVPYTALGFELTADYDERTQVISWRMYVGLAAGLCLPNLYAWCQHDYFDGDIIRGTIWVTSLVAITILLTGCLPAVLCREELRSKPQHKIKLMDAIMQTIKDRAFRLLLSGYLIVIIGILTASALALYVNIYYVFDGNKKLAAEVSAFGGMLAVIGAYAGVRIATIISAKTGKREVMMGGLTLALMAVLSMIYTMQPGFVVVEIWGFKLHPMAISFFFYGMGQQASWLLIDSMTADICDEDELRTGLRREGMYGAVKSLAQKAGVAITGLTGGFTIKLAGAADAQEGLSSEVASYLKEQFILIQCVGIIIAIIIFYRYPLTRAQSESTRERLKKINQSA